MRRGFLWCRIGRFAAGFRSTARSNHCGPTRCGRGASALYLHSACEKLEPRTDALLAENGRGLSSGGDVNTCNSYLTPWPTARLELRRIDPSNYLPISVAAPNLAGVIHDSSATALCVELRWRRNWETNARCPLCSNGSRRDALVAFSRAGQLSPAPSFSLFFVGRTQEPSTYESGRGPTSGEWMSRHRSRFRDFERKASHRSPCIRVRPRRRAACARWL